MKYIYGLNKSGQSIINYLNKIEENYCCWDDNIEIRKQLIKDNNNINLVKPDDLDHNLIKESFVSPGISLNEQKIKILKKKNISLYRDLELYSRIAKDKKIIAITGTNGKSTTTKLISEILSKNNIANFLGGNIGIPLLDFFLYDKEVEHHVIELSSFQLESTSSFDPYISILLNISHDHLDRYKDYEDYIHQKEKIIICNTNGFNILCIDDEKTLKIYNQHKDKIIPISRKYLKKGIFYKKNLIIDNYFEIEKEIKIDYLPESLSSTFHIENILAAYTVSKILNICDNDFKNILSNFEGLPHRSEKIFKNNSFQIINNSKATNLHATIKSIENFDNIHLILGGRAKEKDFDKIIKFKERINQVYLIGESSPQIYNDLKNELICKNCLTLDIALESIFKNISLSEKFQTILFSPACSSFDQFIDFEDRGEYFKKMVKIYIT